MRVRGLKHLSMTTLYTTLAVAPHAGAWIETPNVLDNGPSEASHPMRVRGLKLNGHTVICSLSSSHPMRVRGLKLFEELFGPNSFGRTPCGCVD